MGERFVAGNFGEQDVRRATAQVGLDPLSVRVTGDGLHAVVEVPEEHAERLAAMLSGDARVYERREDAELQTEQPPREGWSQGATGNAGPESSGPNTGTTY